MEARRSAVLMRLQLLVGVVSSTAAVAVQPMAPATPPSSALSRHWLELRRNEAAHQKDVEESVQIGYQRIRELPASVPSATPIKVPPSALGLGSASPFDGEDLLHVSASPVLTEDECKSIIAEAKVHVAACDGVAQSGFTLADTNHNIRVADLPRTLDFVNAQGLPRVAALAGQCFGDEAIGDPTELCIYRALVVGYDAASGLTHQEVHRDGALVTCVISLSERDAYAGGGTFIEALGEATAPAQGHAVLHPSALRHAGHMITSGERWVLVLFLISTTMSFGEHVFRFKNRALRLAEEGDYDGEALCLSLAREVCDDADHELLYDVATAAHVRGEIAEAVPLYERAAILCGGVDKLLLNNLGAAYAQLGQRDDALAAFRCSLQVAPGNAVALNELAKLGVQV